MVCFKVKMKLDGREFDVPNHLFDEFFACIDRFEKVILSNDSNPKPITKEQESKYTIYSVADHVIALPKESKKELEEFLVYLEN